VSDCDHLLGYVRGSSGDMLRVHASHMANRADIEWVDEFDFCPLCGVEIEGDLTK